MERSIFTTKDTKDSKDHAANTVFEMGHIEVEEITPA
jgi:hypothetical protein